MFIRIFAFILLFILSPIFLILALVILIEDGFPVFFTQKRIGINYTFFNIYKFRSMKKNTPNVATHLLTNPDQYLLRTGTNWTRNALTISLGGRYECIPANDLIGDNTGFRRPGSVLAIEPGVNYSYKKLIFYLYTPIAVRNERPQSYPDILRTNDTKIFARGDAAFANYSINIGFGYKF